MDGFPTSLRPLARGNSGETFLDDEAGEQAVVRVTGPRSAHRGPLAPEIDATVLALGGGLLPVPPSWRYAAAPDARGDLDAAPDSGGGPVGWTLRPEGR